MRIYKVKKLDNREPLDRKLRSVSPKQKYISKKVRGAGGRSPEAVVMATVVMVMIMVVTVVVVTVVMVMMVVIMVICITVVVLMVVVIIMMLVMMFKYGYFFLNVLAVKWKCS